MIERVNKRGIERVNERVIERVIERVSCARRVRVHVRVWLGVRWVRLPDV